MDFIFRYQVGGKEYRDSRARVKLFDAFGDKAFEKGDRFEITHNPEDPTDTIYQRKIYDRILSLGVGLILLATAIFLGALAFSQPLRRPPQEPEA